MNIEKTMEFILQQQAKAEGQMTAIRTLLRTGMRMVVKNEQHIEELTTAHKELAEAQKATETELRALATAQKVTEVKLQNFIDAQRRGGNGNHRKK